MKNLITLTAVSAVWLVLSSFVSYATPTDTKYTFDNVPCEVFADIVKDSGEKDKYKKKIWNFDEEYINRVFDKPFNDWITSDTSKLWSYALGKCGMSNEKLR